MFPHVLVQPAGHLPRDLCPRLQIHRPLLPEGGERGAGGLPGPGDRLPDARLQDGGGTRAPHLLRGV